MSSVVIAVIGIAIVAAVAAVLLGGSVQSGGGGGRAGVREQRPDDDLVGGAARWRRSLDEIAFDNASGKLSDGDYEELRAKYQAALMKELKDMRGGVAADDLQGGGPPPKTESTEPSPAANHPNPATPSVSTQLKPSAAYAAPTLTASSELPLTAGAPATTAAAPDPAEALVARMRADRSTCPSCGPRPEPGARYCSSCGRFLRNCHECGAQPDQVGARFCSSCGSSLAA